MTSGSDGWIMREMNRGGRSEETWYLGDVGLEDEATYQCMFVFVAESVYLGRRRVRACAGSNQRDTRLSEKLVQ